MAKGQNETIPLVGQNETIPLVEEQDGDWWRGKETVGTPGVPITFNFETASSDTIASLSDYDPSKPLAFQNAHATFEQTHGDGRTASGSIYYDTVQLGSLTLKNATIGRSQHDTFKEQGVAGLDLISDAELISFGTASVRTERVQEARNSALASGGFRRRSLQLRAHANVDYVLWSGDGPFRFGSSFNWYDRLGSLRLCTCRRRRGTERRCNECRRSLVQERSPLFRPG